MTRCLTTQFDLHRSSLADRPKPLVAIIQNAELNCILSAELTELPQPRWRNTTATAAHNSINPALAASSASPANALPP